MNTLMRHIAASYLINPASSPLTACYTKKEIEIGLCSGF